MYTPAENKQVQRAPICAASPRTAKCCTSTSPVVCRRHSQRSKCGKAIMFHYSHSNLCANSKMQKREYHTDSSVHTAVTRPNIKDAIVRACPAFVGENCESLHYMNCRISPALALPAANTKRSERSHRAICHLARCSRRRLQHLQEQWMGAPSVAALKIVQSRRSAFRTCTRVAYFVLLAIAA